MKMYYSICNVKANCKLRLFEIVKEHRNINLDMFIKYNIE